MARYTHVPGLHPAVKFPPDWLRFGWGQEQHGFIFTLAEDCRYQITGPEVDGYNKAGGISFGIDAQDKAAMLGWQPADPPYFAFAFYWHDGTGGFNFNRQPGMVATPGEQVAWWCQVDYRAELVTCFFQTQASTARYVQPIKIPGLGKFHRDIHPFFGDEGRPPHRMTFYKERIWHWQEGLPYEVKQWGNPPKTIAL